MSHAHLPAYVVAALPDLSGRALRLVVAIASHMPKAFPGRERLMATAGIGSKVTFAQALRELREMQVVEVIDRRGQNRTFEYRWCEARAVTNVPECGTLQGSDLDTTKVHKQTRPMSQSMGHISIQDKSTRISRRAGGAGCRTAAAHAPLIMSAWNHFAQGCGLPTISRVTDKRLRHLTARWDDGTIGRMHDLFCEIRRSRFLQGDNDRGWTVSFDWLYGKPDNAVKVLEGKYRDLTPHRPVEEAPELSQQLIDELEAEAEEMR